MAKSVFATIVAFLGVGSAWSSNAKIFEGVPDVIVCEIVNPAAGRSGRMVFYLHSQEDGKETRYTSLGAAPMQIVVGADNKVADNKNLTDCAGKSVSQLHEEHHAFDHD